MALLDKVAFMRRLTLPVLAQVLARESSDPLIAGLRFWLDNVSVVDTDTLEAQQGAGYLESLGIPGCPKAADLLAPVIDPADQGAGTWYVAFDSKTGEVNREGPDVIENAPGYTVMVYGTAPKLWDTFSGKRLLRWDPALRDYAPEV